MSARVREPWVPMKSPRFIALLGKFVEETGEAQQRAGRCLIQGLLEYDPDNGTTNLELLEEEIADMLAVIQLMKSEMRLQVNELRVAAKLEHLIPWLDDLEVR